MYLKKLELCGFKSFAEKTEIIFDKGITAIVGPNGTGKSNVADAVRWVLGEQSTKSLRTQKMDDVIFGGTENRKPLSYCEVSLTFDNGDGELRIDFTEVTVTRRSYRSGESEYLINQNQCRLKDISELFRDTGIGKEGYSLIGQGRIDEILSSKPEERRAVFEEAAGIGKYRVRKEEAERKLYAAEQDVIRIQDVISELERQLGPLAKQCEETRKYLVLKDKLKELDLNLFLSKYDQGKERLESLKNMVQGLAEQCGARVREEEQINSELARYDNEAAEQEQSIRNLRERYSDITAEISGKHAEKSITLERIHTLREEQERIKGEMDRNGISRESKEKEKKECVNKSIDASKAIDDINIEIKSATEKYNNILEEITSQGNKLNDLQCIIKESMSRLYEEKNKAAGMEASKSASLTRLQDVVAQLEVLTQTILTLKEQESSCSQTLKDLATEIKTNQTQKNDIISRANEVTYKINQLTQSSAELGRKSAENDSRLKMLENMQRDYEGFSNSIRSLFKDSETRPQLKSRMHGAVAQLISVPSEYRKAVEMALGPALNNIVTENEEDAKYLIEYLRSSNLGRATFLPIASIKPRLFSQQEYAAMNVRGFKGVASDLITYEKKYTSVIQSLLARTAIVENMDAGIELARKTSYAFRIATMQGDIINAGGSMTGGSTGGRSTSLLGRQDTIDEARKLKVGIEEKLIACGREKDALSDKLKGFTEEIKALDLQIRQAELTEAKEKERLISIRNSIASKEEEYQTRSGEKSRIEISLKEAAEIIASAGVVSSDLENEADLYQNDEKKERERYETLQNQRDELIQTVSSLRIRAAELEKETASQKNIAERVSLEIAGLLQDSQGKQNTLDMDEIKIKEHLSIVDSLEKKIVELENIRHENENQIEKNEQQRKSRMSKTQTILDKRAQINAQMEQLRERSHRAELSVAKLESDIDNITVKIWDEYELTYLGAEKYRLQTIPEDAQNQIDNIRRTLRTMSNINPNAIEDYNNVKERFDYLSSQSEDLTKAQGDLRQLIDDLTQRMKKQFKEQFELINTNFAVTFKQLFGGGKATLVLGDENDIMDCTIDIIAQPPGKNLKLISLSGGEKTLTAIALLFAILKLKPTPFCLLDEIDAALDEANTERFSGYIKEFARKTQFILITHRRATMANSEIIYGMAMEEKGVSKMVSVRLEKEAVS